MDKFSFKFPNRLKVTLEKHGEENVMVFSAKSTDTLMLDKAEVYNLTACKQFNGFCELKDESETVYLLKVFHEVPKEGHIVFENKVHLTLQVLKGKNLHEVIMTQRDFKKFIKMCKEVYCNE